MVATRNHPRDFDPPAPTESPTKRSTRATTTGTTAAMPKEPPQATTNTHTTTTTTLSSPPKPQPVTRPTRTSSLPSPTQRSEGSHTPSNLTLLWLALSLPLVIWDTGYVLLRPYTLPGGSLHHPLWTPYALYGKVDMVYSSSAWESGLGFTAAQGSLNLVETAMYGYYLYLVFVYGVQERRRQGTGAPDVREGGWLGWMGESRTVYGREGRVAVLVGYTTFVLTFSKTVLYWLNEAFTGFSGIGHNSWSELLWLWIIPNGLWLVFPVYLGYVFGVEIVEGLGLSAGGATRKSR